MPKVTFIDHTGHLTTVEAKDGVSVMQAAISNGVVGILADCGGACACATCHVIVAPEWFAQAGRPGADEAQMMEFTAEPAQPTSRLACQIKLDAALDGLVVQLPLTQS